MPRDTAWRNILLQQWAVLAPEAWMLVQVFRNLHWETGKTNGDAKKTQDRSYLIGIIQP